MRPLYKFYPQAWDGELYVPRGHGVKSEGFKSLKEGKYMYSILSPLVEFGNRRYFLEFSDPAQLDLATLTPSHFRGLIGESVMRIILMEFMRRQQHNLGLDEFNFIKQKNGKKIFLENSDYQAEHFGKYNVRFVTNTSHVVAEFDGLMNYRLGRQKGIILCEAKTGRLDMYENPKGHEDEIIRKIVNPLYSLFPEDDKDFILMAKEDSVLGSDRKLITNLADLTEILNYYDIGFIPFTFPDSKETMLNVSKSIASLNKRLKNDKHTLERKLKQPGHEAIVKGNAIYIIKKGRIEMILERSGEKTYTTLFRR